MRSSKRLCKSAGPSTSAGAGSKEASLPLPSLSSTVLIRRLPPLVVVTRMSPAIAVLRPRCVLTTTTPATTPDADDDDNDDGDDSLPGGGDAIDLDEVLAAAVEAREDASLPSRAGHRSLIQRLVRDSAAPSQSDPPPDPQPLEAHTDALQASRSRFVWVNYVLSCTS